MTTERIRWEPTRNGGFEGYVGTLEPSAFTIWKYRSDVAWWTLTGNLGAMRECPHGDDPEALKAEAERWLERFVSSLGAVFPAEPDESTEFQLSEARDVLARWDAGQDGCPECSREKVLADHVRALLAIVDREAASTAGEDR